MLDALILAWLFAVARYVFLKLLVYFVVQGVLFRSAVEEGVVKVFAFGLSPIIL